MPTTPPLQVLHGLEQLQAELEAEKEAGQGEGQPICGCSVS